MLNVIDEFPRECLAIRVAWKLNSVDLLDGLSDRFILRGVPGHIRSDHGLEFVAKAVRAWIAVAGAKTIRIEPGSPLGDPLIAVPAGTDRQLCWRWEKRSACSFGSRREPFPAGPDRWRCRRWCEACWAGCACGRPAARIVAAKARER